MELYLLRFLSAATLVLALGLAIGQWLRRRRGASAGNEALRVALVAVVVCALLPSAPAPLPSVATLPAEIPAVAISPAPVPVEAPVTTVPELPDAAVPSVAASEPAPTPWTPPDRIATIAIVWAIGALLGLGMLARGHVLLRRLRRHSRPVDLPAPVPVRESACLDAPLLAGVVRPVLYLPADGPIRDEPDALAAALAHESAHLTRRDLPWSLFSSVLRALLWFHPLVHLAHRLLAQTAEEACDTIAAQQDRRAYADLLLRLSESMARVAPQPSVGMALFKSRVGQRIAAMLSDRLTRPLTPAGRIALRIGALGLVAVGTSLVGAARLVPEVAAAPQETPKMTPPAPGTRLIEGGGMRSDGTVYTFVRRTVTMRVAKMPLAQAVAELSRISLYPIEVDPKLQGTVTLDVHNEEIEKVLPKLCPQIRPAASALRIDGPGYKILPMPPVGKIAGRVLRPDGKPAAGVRVSARSTPPGEVWPKPDDPFHLTHYSNATTDAQGHYTLERIAEYPYAIHTVLHFPDGMVSPERSVAGKPGRTIAASDLRLTRGAVIEVEVPEARGPQNALHPRIRPEDDSPTVFETGPVRPVKRYRVSAGRVSVGLAVSGVPDDSALADLTAATVDGAPLSHDGRQVRLTVRDGQIVRVSLKGRPNQAQIAALAKRRERFLANNRESMAESAADSTALRVATKLVTPPKGPTPLGDAVRAMCRQAGVTDVEIAPGLAGTVGSEGHPRFLGHALEEVCVQANPPAFPVWQGAKLKIVAAPAPGIFDPVNCLYRLKGLPSAPRVYAEPKRGNMTGGDSGRDGVTVHFFDTPGAEALTVRLADYDHEDRPVAGATVYHETHGRIVRLTTNAQGMATVPILEPGRHYVYLPPGNGWSVAGSGSGGSGERYVRFQVSRGAPGAMDSKWMKRVTLDAKDMPFQDAIRAVCGQIGVARIKFPPGLNPKVTLKLEGMVAAEALFKISHAAHSSLVPELREPLTFRR